MIRNLTSAFFVLLLAIGLSSCDEAPSPAIHITDLSFKQGHQAGVAYFTLKNEGQSPDRLLAVTSPNFGRIEIHTTIMTDGIMRMRRLEDFPIAPAATYIFKAKGDHLMLFEPQSGPRPSTMTFHFENAPSVTVSAARIEQQQAPGSH